MGVSVSDRASESEELPVTIIKSDSDSSLDDSESSSALISGSGILAPATASRWVLATRTVSDGVVLVATAVGVGVSGVEGLVVLMVDGMGFECGTVVVGVIDHRW